MMKITKQKIFKNVLILISFLLITIFFLYYSGVIRYLVMHIDNYDYNPPLKHEDYSSYKLSIPYTLVPLIPNKIGLNKNSYYQLKSIDNNLDYYTYDNLDYYSSFKSKKFDIFSFEVDDSNYVVSFLIYKERNMNDILKFKENLKNDLIILEKYYGIKYKVFYSNLYNKFDIRWSEKEYYVYLSISNYLVKKNQKKYFYLIDFSKVNTNFEELYDISINKDYKEVNKKYLKELGLK